MTGNLTIMMPLPVGVFLLFMGLLVIALFIALVRYCISIVMAG